MSAVATSPVDIDRAAIRAIGGFLSEIGFAQVTAQVGGGSVRMFMAPFLEVQELLKNTSPFYRLVFSLLCQGHAVADRYLRAALTPVIIDALASSRVIARDADGNWQTNNVCVLALDGLFLLTSLPPHYPTARDNRQPVYLGIESLALAEAMPGHCGGRAVLDMCAGGGLHALLAAARGAHRVVAVDVGEDAVAAARFNAVLNGLDERVEVRQGDLFDAVGSEERFDLIVTNPPSAAGPRAYPHPAWGAGGVDGTACLRRLLPRLDRALATNGEALLALHALGRFSSIHLNEAVFADLAIAAGLTVTAFVHTKKPITQYQQQLEQMIEALYPEVAPEARRARIREWRDEAARAGGPVDFIYSQIVRITRDGRAPGAHYVPTYPVARTDPLVGTVGADL